MAPEAQPAKPLEVMMKNLKLSSSSSGGNGTMAAARDGNSSDATSCISSSGDAASSIKGSDVEQESFMAEQGMYYPESGYCGYYYPGYDMLSGEWCEQGYFLQYDGLEMQYPVIQADNGSLIYFMPGFQPGFNPYGSCMSSPMTSVDGQYISQYPYLSNQMFPQSPTSLGGLPYLLPYGSEVVPVWSSDPSIYVTAANGNGFVEAPTFAGSKPNIPSAPSHALSPPTKPITPSKPSVPHEMKCTSAALHVPPLTDTNSHSVKPVNKGVAAFSNGHCPIAKIPSHPNQGKGGFLYPDGPVDIKANGKNWGGIDKIKASDNTNGVCDLGLSNEHNCGPRTNCTKSAWVPGADFVGSNGNNNSSNTVKNGNNNSISAIIRRDQYNLPDFPTKYVHALFFVIKSYSEDDIHRSIKYGGVWSSTPNGNKKLDSAYQDAHERTRATGSICPVLLFFSVNASGQFCGVAEMIGRVDFKKNMDFWHQDKWNGFFPVKWHIIKDVPNAQLRHIILENNENKPVTNSRDTQEVKFPQGTEMLNIFKNYSAKTCIFDDFGFYENREKAMQDKRIMQFAPRFENLEHKADEGVQVAKVADLKGAVGHQFTELTASMKNK